MLVAATSFQIEIDCRSFAIASHQAHTQVCRPICVLLEYRSRLVWVARHTLPFPGWR